MASSEPSSKKPTPKPTPLPPVSPVPAASECDKGVEGGRSNSAWSSEPPPSPGVDVFAVLGIPRPKRLSEKSDQAEEMDQVDGDESDDCSDTDDELELCQEGEYLVMEEDEELKELQLKMLSENASLSRASLVPIFTSCSEAFEAWLAQNQTSMAKDELDKRKTQLQLHRKVIQLYRSDAEWTKLTHAQRVERNREAHQLSLQAKDLGPPPVEVSETMIAEPLNKDCPTGDEH